MRRTRPRRHPQPIAAVSLPFQADHAVTGLARQAAEGATRNPHVFLVEQATGSFGAAAVMACASITSTFFGLPFVFAPVAGGDEQHLAVLHHADVERVRADAVHVGSCCGSENCAGDRGDRRGILRDHHRVAFGAHVTSSRRTLSTALPASWRGASASTMPVTTRDHRSARPARRA